MNGKGLIEKFKKISQLMAEKNATTEKRKKCWMDGKKGIDQIFYLVW